MKKLVIACGVVAMSVFATSCKKDYTCSCSFDGQTQDFKYEGVKKGDAESTCDSQETQLKTVYADASCSLD